MSLLRQSALAALSAITMAGSRFAFTAILTRRLSVDEFGRFAYAQWLVDIAFLACALGATGAVSRYAAEFRSDERTLQTFIRVWRRWALGISLLSGFVVLFGAWLSGYEIDTLSKLLLSAWAVTSGILAMQMAALSGFQRFELIFRSNLIFALIILAGSWLLPLNSTGTPGLFALMAVASGVASVPGLVVSARLINDDSPALSTDQWQKIRNYALNMWLVALLWSLVWSRGELPIVKTLLGDGGVASYVAVLTLFGGAIQGVMLGVSAVAPQLTGLWGRGLKDEAVALARSVMDLQLLVCGVAALALIYMGPELLSLAFGANYRTHSNALAILSIGLVSMVVANQNHLLQIATDGRFSRNSLVVSLFILMGLAFLLTGLLGIAGAAAARALTMLFLAGLAIYSTINRWGRMAVSLQNISIAGLIILASVFISLIANEVDGIKRILMLLISSLILMFAIKDSSGNIKIKIILKTSLKRLLPVA